MKPTKDNLRAIKIFNSYELCKEANGKVWVYYSKGEARACRCDQWVVASPFFKTDPDAHWQDGGCKVFLGKMRSPAFEEAKQWASEKYGIKEWVRDPWGGWQDVCVMEKAKELLKESFSNK